MNGRRAFPIAVLATALCACKTGPITPPYGEGLSTVWAEMFAPYGIYPLFPVRTNVQPGDVYILCRKRPATVAEGAASAPFATVSSPQHDPRDTTSAIARGEWVQLFWLKGIPQQMEEFAKSRLAYHLFALTPAQSASAPLTAASGPQPFGTNAAPSSIGLASFPSVLSYTQKRSDFGVGTVVGVAAIGAGGSALTQGHYTLEIPAAEHAYLPFSSLQKAVASTTEGLDDYVDAIAAALGAIRSGDCLDGSLSVVGEVFYTRRLVVSMGNSAADALSARAAYQLPTDSTRSAIYKAIGAYASGASAPAAPASSPFPENARFAKLMLDIDAAVGAADTNSKLGFTGIKIGFAKSSGTGVSMEYEYAKPMAFGVRLFPLRIESGGESGPRLTLPLTASADSPKGGEGVRLSGTLKQTSAPK